MLRTAVRFRSARRFRVIVAGLLALPLLLLSAAARADSESVTDTPAPVISDAVDSWDIGSGMIYWGKDCFADEFGRAGFLKRRPLAGGTQRTLEETDAGHCDMPFSLTAEDDGVYYVDLSENRIERTPLSEPYDALVVSTPAAVDLPSFAALIDVAGDYVYWPAAQSGRILRALRSGGDPEVVAAGLDKPNAVTVVGNSLYFMDKTGIWSASLSCGTLPCDKSRFVDFPANTVGSSLLYRDEDRQRYSFTWVQSTASGGAQTSSVYRLTCSAFQPCTSPILTPGATAAAADATSALVYAAAADWTLGGLVSDGTNLFWAESYGIQGRTDGKIKRTPLSGGDPVDIATNQTGIDTRRLVIANGTLHFARLYDAAGIYSLPLNASAIVRDLAADGLEVTQAIQNLANNALLTGDKPTYVRAYAKQLSGPNTPSVDARLIGTRNGSPLPGSPLTPLNGTRSLVTGGAYDRARLNDGWLFLLPTGWTAKGSSIILQLEVDPHHSQTDNVPANNTLSRTVQFASQPPVCVWTVPVRTHTPLPSVTDPNFWSMVDQFTRRWPTPDTWIYRDTNPVEELEVCWAGPLPYPCFGPYELDDGWSVIIPPDRDKVIVSLWTRQQLSFKPDACNDAGAPLHFMGMVHPDAENGGASGYASLISNQSWVQLPPHSPNPAPNRWDQLYAGGVMSQELAHNYGRKHIDCGGPEDIDANYPYPPCQISNVGQAGYYGFDTATRTPIAPDAAADFMSYIGVRNWVSDYTWKALFNSFASVSSAAAAPQRIDADESVFVTGVVDMTGSRGALNTVLVLPTASVPTEALNQAALQVVAQPAAVDHNENPHAAFTLRLLAADDAQILEQPLTILSLDDHVADTESGIFNAIFAKPNGTVARVQLLADGELLDEWTPGTAVPAVTLQQPAGGENIADTLTIKWSASDADAVDHLRFTLQYTPDDGASWQTLATDIPDTPAGSYTFTLSDLGSMPGSDGATARVRVLAGDGYNTGIALSQPFTVANRKPLTIIFTPVEGQVYPATDAVILRGSATDPEDGGLSGESLAWTVDEVDAGTGNEVPVTWLAPGDHTAKLTATDGNANSASAQVNFTIAPLSLPLGAAPQMDGFCTDEAYTGAASVRLSAYEDASQGVVHLLRSADALWVCFSELRPGASDPGALVGVRVDVNNSRDTNAQSDDAGFFVGEDGDVFTASGDGAGGFAGSGPGGLTGQVSAQSERWSAELRIDAAVLGGWDHMAGLQLGHYGVDFQGDDYGWPATAVWNRPDTWALTALGGLPTLTNMDPYTATVGAPAQTLTLTGDGFTADSQAFWKGEAVPTTFVDTNTLSVDVAAARLASAGNAAVTVGETITASLVSNALAFQVTALPPQLNSVTPSSVAAGSEGMVITVNGARFSADSRALWNGTPLPTTFVNSSRLTAQVSTEQLALGREIGITVQNQTPQEAISDMAIFTVRPAGEGPVEVYLPFIRR